MEGKEYWNNDIFNETARPSTLKKERREGETIRRDLFFITSTINGKTNIKKKVYDLVEPLAHYFVIYIEEKVKK